MAIPDYQAFMLPLLRALSDGQVHRVRDVVRTLADEFQLSDEERKTRLRSGQQTIIANRVGWAKTYLKKSGLLDNPARGRICISDEGRKVLALNLQDISQAFLERYPTFLEFKDQTKVQSPTATTLAAAQPAMTPSELLEASFETLQEATKSDLLAKLKSVDPAFFEKTVMKLLVAMGYGGVNGEAKVTGQPGDGGIDGTISEDKLGLDVICVQAKRYDSSPVGRQVVQQFSGSMDIHRSKKGVILTTSEFTREARDFVQRIEGKKVVLIDGKMLAELMVFHNIGVNVAKRFEVKEISNDFFDDEEE